MTTNQCLQSFSSRECAGRVRTWGVSHPFMRMLSLAEPILRAVCTDDYFHIRNYEESGHKLSALRILGSFRWTSVTYDWLMVALSTVDQS